MTSADLSDLRDAETLLPAVTALAATFDREFQRREPHLPTSHQYAAEQLGVPAGDVVACSSDLEPAVTHAVGRWLYDTHHRVGAAAVGSRRGQAARTVLVPGASDDVRAFSDAVVVLPAGTVHTSACVVRLVTEAYGDQVELIGRAADADELATVLDSLLRRLRREASPYQRGCYRVSSTNRGLVLKRWTPLASSRASLMLPAAVWDTVDRSVHRVLELAADLTARGLGSSAGLLLVGPPGTGKTQLGTVVANELAGTATVLLPDTQVTEHWLVDLFDLAGDLAPCLILMDDLDLIAGQRGSTNPHRLREFLNVMDGGLADRSGVVVVASTNDHRKIDKAARRSSRFDTVITMDAPGADGRRAILRRYLAWSPVHLDLEPVVRATEGATGADLKELIRAAVLETRDEVTTQALLDQVRLAPWHSDAAPVGDYL